MRAAKLYDLLAPVYARFLCPVLEVANSRAAERLTGGAPESALEIAVGPGQALAALARTAKRVVGVDVSPAMLRRSRMRVREQGSDAHLARADAVRLPFSSGTFDAVLSTFLLDVLPEVDHDSMLEELFRVLAPGGRAVLGALELPNPVVARAWMTVYRVAPDVLGGARPVDLMKLLNDRPARVIRDERLDGLLAMRIVTLVKVSA
ncbi:MAG TPA: class I SAM-dependent methyltransferase [Gemmatimonadales bacterium]|nr:class I SAM-dependent methyltransferase [Gemmatimonadales bacterium]